MIYILTFTLFSIIPIFIVVCLRNKTLEKECQMLADEIMLLRALYVDKMNREQSRLAKAIEEGWGPKSVEQTIDEGWTN